MHECFQENNESNASNSEILNKRKKSHAEIKQIE